MILRFSVLAVSGILCAPLPAADIPPQYQEVFDWLDKRGASELIDKSLVSLRQTWGDQEYADSNILGFLLSEDDEGFEILNLNFHRQTFARSEQSPYYEGRKITRTFSRLDPLEVAEAVISGNDKQHFFDRSATDGIKLFLLARYFAAKGDNAMVNRLCASGIERLNRPNDPKNQQLDVISKLAIEISHDLTWRAVKRFGDPAVTREELLGDFKQVFRFYPQCKHRQRVKNTIAILQRMVNEDKRYAASKSPDKPTKQQRINDLIFRLRDQNGQQWSQPGSCDIFSGDRGVFSNDTTQHQKSPGWQLKEMGYDAIPHLIEVLDDQSFTRSVGYHRDFYFSHHVLRVGDCAERIIAEIAGRPFYVRRHTNGAMQKDGKEQTVKQEIEAWWKDFQNKGEESVLIDAVRRGDRAACASAERLAKRYPRSALNAISAGVNKTDNEWIRVQLIQSTKKLQGPNVNKFLREQMVTAGDLMSRVTAAEELFKRNDRSAIEAMMKQWKVHLQAGHNLKELERLVAFFKTCKSRDAIDMIGRDFKKLPVDVRLEIVTLFGEPNTTNAIDDSAVRILMEAAGDKQKRLGMSGSYGEFNFSDPRVCDFAGHFLSKRKEYEFDHSESEAKKDIALTRIRNQWRAKHGMDVLPLPKLRTNPGLDPKVIQPLIEHLRSTETQPQRVAATDAIRAMGIRALPAVIAASNQTNDEAVTASLDQLRIGLANSVTELAVATEVAMGEPLEAEIESLKGKTLTGQKLFSFLITMMRNLPKGHHGITIGVRRDVEPVGIKLTIEFEKDRNPQIKNANGWSNHISIRAANRMLTSQSGSSSGDHVLSIDGHSDEIELSDKALNSTLGTTVEIDISFSRS